MRELNVADRPAHSRTSTRLKRHALIFVSLAVTMSITYFALPWVQHLTLPSRPAGQAWLIKPERLFHIGAAALVAIAITSVGLLPIRMQWQLEDRETNPPKLGFMDRFHQHRRTVLTLLAGLIAFAFYIRSHAIVDDSGIALQKPWSKTHHHFDEVVGLRTIPDGGRNEQMKKNGPWFQLALPGEASFEFSSENEGLSPAELESLRTFLEQRTGKPWTRIDDGYGGP